MGARRPWTWDASGTLGTCGSHPAYVTVRSRAQPVVTRLPLLSVEGTGGAVFLPRITSHAEDYVACERRPLRPRANFGQCVRGLPVPADGTTMSAPRVSGSPWRLPAFYGSA